MNNMGLPCWVEVTRSDLRQMTDDEVREMYTQMTEDQYNEYTCDAAGNSVLVTKEQKTLIGKHYRGRGLASKNA